MDRFTMYYCILTLQAATRHSEAKRLGMHSIDFKLRRLQAMCDGLQRQEHKARVLAAFRQGRTFHERD